MNWVNRIRLMQVSKIAIVVCVILSTVLAGFTIYGEKVGSFVIDTVEDSPNISIALSEYEDLSHQTDRLAVKGLEDQRDTTFYDIPYDISRGIGAKTDTDFRRYIAHSFYVVNNSTMAVDLFINMSITAIEKDVDSAVRVEIIYGDDYQGSIYAKWQEEQDSEGIWIDKLENGERVPEVDPDAGETVMFLSDSLVFQDTVNELQAGDALKITIVVWLEGWDTQCVDDIYGGAIRMIMNIKAY